MCYVILWILSILNHLNLSLYYTFGNKKLPQTEMYDKIIYGFSGISICGFVSLFSVLVARGIFCYSSLAKIVTSLFLRYLNADILIFSVKLPTVNHRISCREWILFKKIFFPILSLNTQDILVYAFHNQIICLNNGIK